jgi:hypothetical protein
MSETKVPCPGESACAIIKKIQQENLGKHKKDSWYYEPGLMHLFKGIRHLLTGTLILFGFQRSDGENHFHLGLTRIALFTAHPDKSLNQMLLDVMTYNEQH